MKTFIVMCLFGFSAVAFGEMYTDKYDNMDIDEIITNERLLQVYYNCLMDSGPCPPEAAELKKNLGDALATDCGKCTEPQKGGTKKMIRYLINFKPEMWNNLCGKYDPGNLYRTKHEQELKELKE